MSAAPANLRRAARLEDRLAGLLTYAVLAAMTAVAVYPVVWMALGSLKAEAEFYTNIWGAPSVFAWNNYALAWQRANLGVKFLNSLVVAAGTLAVVLPVSSLAAYAFAKLRFPGSRLFFYLLLLGMMIPEGVNAIPIFSVVVRLGLLNTRLSLILVYAAQSLGFGVFLMHAFFKSLPRELEEAALIDGCSPLGAFVRVILPLARPGLATQVVFTGLSAWNEYFLASILIRREELQTLPLGIVHFTGRYATNYPQLFAALAIVTLPVVALYIFSQKQFISGMTAGALKG